MSKRELKQQREELVQQQRALLAAADDETRAMSSDEFAQFEGVDKQINALDRTIEAHDKVGEDRTDMRIFAADTATTSVPEAAATSSNRKVDRGTDEYRSAFDGYLRSGVVEQRALEVGTNSEGGYLAPQSWHSAIVESRDEVNVMRPLATVIETSTGTFNLPTMSSKGSAAWTTEEAAHTESDPAFGSVTFSAHKASTLVKVSSELLQDSAFDLASFLAKEFGRRLGALEEAAFVDGDDSGKPKGAIYNAGVGVTAASATAVTGAELISLFHSLDRQYRDNASWVMHDDTIQLMRKLVDGNSQYLWSPGLAATEPPTLLGRPVYASSNVGQPTSASKSILFADLSYYYIVDRAGIAIQRLNELYAANDQVGFLASARTDGELVITDAAKVLQMA